MKPSTKLKKANVHYNKAMALIGSLREQLVALLDDDSAHISFATDGLVIAYRGGFDNAWLNVIDIDELMRLTDKKEALEILDKARI
ncbi:hypothetical protein KO527_05305 [Pseudoalteromonas sp. C2R02]|uniref:hypothetical protein n=1 Tax=Pseudoalteromonas sp. C2R02 TaxID=2841565 RepID=UPI001C07F1EB|nr:hypothetical protein [Pseudoalteromonas sp. C2R02]MBU2968765.1 hypothetical protein [Pseudoalteromonas sp. C2R02]